MSRWNELTNSKPLAFGIGILGTVWLYFGWLLLLGIVGLSSWDAHEQQPVCGQFGIDALCDIHLEESVFLILPFFLVFIPSLVLSDLILKYRTAPFALVWLGIGFFAFYMIGSSYPKMILKWPPELCSHPSHDLIALCGTTTYFYLLLVLPVAAVIVPLYLIFRILKGRT